MDTLALDHYSFRKITELETRMFLEERSILNIIKEETSVFLREQRDYGILREENRRVQDINSQILNEISLGDIGHFALDIAGAIPGVGEVADLANAALYAGKGQFFMAALSAISMVPVVGDVIGKGGKLATLLAKGGASKVGKAVMWLKKMFSKYWAKIKAGLSKLKNNKYIGEHIDDMMRAVTDFLKTPDESKEAVQAVSQASNLASPVDDSMVKKGKDAIEKASPNKEKEITPQKER